MGGNYEKNIYNQLMDVMARLDAMECNLRVEKKEHKEDVDRLNKKIDSLTEENQLLREDNARLKSIINNDSSNTSLPPSTDQKGGKPANTYNGRNKTDRKVGGQKGHKGTTLTKADVEEKIQSGRCRHEVKTIGNTKSTTYVTKYIVDLNVETVITEVRIYADKDGKFHIPSEYRNDVSYGANVKALAVALYSEGVMSNDRIATFLNAVGNDTLDLSEGSVYSFCKRLAKASEESIGKLETSLLNEKIVATDATTVTINGKQNYIRNFSMKDTVIYKAMNRVLQSNVDFLIDFFCSLVLVSLLLHAHRLVLA